MLTTIYDKIYQLAEPYWQTRHNEIHVPMAYAFAQQLLAHYPEADPAVVLPAILLHDVGWKMIPEESLLQGVYDGPKPDNNIEITRQHEVEGARIAAEILASLQYDPAKIGEIQQIIDGHDTRAEALSLNDAVVKDADRLWRFDPTTLELLYTWFQMQPAEYLNFLEQKMASWMLTAAGKEIAQTLLAESRVQFGGKFDYILR